MEEKDKKCIIESKYYGGTYLSGTASYVSNLINAKIFKHSEIQDYQKNNPKNTIIFLDSEKGLELLAREIEHLDTQIPQDQSRLDNLKKGREKLYNANPEMISEYIEKHNFFQHPLIGIKEDTKQRIISKIAKKSQQ